MDVDPLNILDTAGLHTLSLVLDARIANRAGAVVVNFDGHAPVPGTLLLALRLR